MPSTHTVPPIRTSESSDHSLLVGGHRPLWVCLCLKCEEASSSCFLLNIHFCQLTRVWENIYQKQNKTGKSKAVEHLAWGHWGPSATSHLTVSVTADCRSATSDYKSTEAMFCWSLAYYYRPAMADDRSIISDCRLYLTIGVSSMIDCRSHLRWLVTSHHRSISFTCRLRMAFSYLWVHA